MGQEGETAAGRARILVVDDEPSVRILIRRVLERAGFFPHLCEDAETALAHVAEHPVDLVLVDQNLPQMSGRELVRRLRAGRQHLPVVMMTGAPETAGLDEDIEVLGKPFSLALLQETVRRALAARPGLPASVSPPVESTR